jgi:hypothetical protein
VTNPWPIHAIPQMNGFNPHDLAPFTGETWARIQEAINRGVKTFPIIRRSDLIDPR